MALSRDEYLKLSIEDKLRFWIALEHGSIGWFTENGQWDKYIREVCSEALYELEVRI